MMLKKQLLILVSFLLIMSCYAPKTPNKEAPTFKKPILFNSELSQNNVIKKHTTNTNHIESVASKFIGIFSTTDSIDIGKENEIYIDRVLKQSAIDSLDYKSSGLKMIVDYDAEVYVQKIMLLEKEYIKSFPVYLINNSNENKVLYGKDGVLSALQEAQDLQADNTWKPIESAPMPGCGNGHWKIYLKPNEFAVFLMTKYEGNQKTNMRVRFKNGNDILLSNSYEGTINNSQFLVSKDDRMLARIIRNFNKEDIQYFFYGAKVPKVPKMN